MIENPVEQEYGVKFQPDEGQFVSHGTLVFYLNVQPMFDAYYEQKADRIDGALIVSRMGEDSEPLDSILGELGI